MMLFRKFRLHNNITRSYSRNSKIKINKKDGNKNSSNIDDLRRRASLQNEYASAKSGRNVKLGFARKNKSMMREDNAEELEERKRFRSRASFDSSSHTGDFESDQDVIKYLQSVRI